MPSVFLTAIMAFCLVGLLITGPRILAASTLEARLEALRFALIMLAPGLVLLAVALVWHVNAVPGPTAAMKQGTVDPEWAAAVREAGKLQTLVLCFFALLAAGLAGLAIPILRDLRELATTHRADLAGRDQAFLASDPAQRTGP